MIEMDIKYKMVGRNGGEAELETFTLMRTRWLGVGLIKNFYLEVPICIE